MDKELTIQDLEAQADALLGLQFSVLAIGIIVMQSVIVQFDTLGGEMVSNAAQNGFGAANKLNNLLMTPLNGLGAATRMMFSLIFIFLFLQIFYKFYLTNAKCYVIILSRSEESRIILSLLEAIGLYYQNFKL